MNIIIHVVVLVTMVSLTIYIGYKTIKDWFWPE